jgi:hypothetical protein
VEVVNSQTNFNKNGIKTIPIFIYHNNTNQKIKEYDVGILSIDKDLFEPETNYLFDNGLGY